MKSLLFTAAGWIAVSAVVGGCQPPDLNAECARLKADVGRTYRENLPPYASSDRLGNGWRWYDEHPEALEKIREAADPYRATLKTSDPFSFCGSYTGSSGLPLEVPNPFR